MEQALAAPSSCWLAQSALAFGAIKGCVCTNIARGICPDFDDSPIGLRRYGAIVDALQRLDASTPTRSRSCMPSLAKISTVVPRYVQFS